jgi:radical SAM protein with 4Fe4S-binding SPASM domain
MVKNTDIGMELFGAPCIVGKDGIALMPDGTVYPCRRFPLKIGNLREEKLEDILATSDVTKKLNNKNYLKGKCKTCIIDSCFGCRALAYSVTGDFLAEDPLCLIK